MRAAFLVPLCVALVPCTGEIPIPVWPFRTHTTTTPAPSRVSSFESGVAEGLGLTDADSCFTGLNASAGELWQAAKDFNSKNVISKSKAILKIGEAVKEVTTALGHCTVGTTDLEKYKKLVASLKDPRYYTPHNALTLLLNAAEDRHELAAFGEAWDEGDFKTAGSDLITAVLDVMENPGIPESNGTAATQISAGLAKGFATDISFKCLQDARVEIASVIGGVMDVMNPATTVGGLESLFHGLEGLVPTYKVCMAEKPAIMDLLNSFGDFRHPKKLAEKLGRHIVSNGVDLSLETASAVLDVRGKEWERFGQDIGKILGKIVVGNTTSLESGTLLV